MTAKGDWTVARTERLADGTVVRVSKPVLVARSQGYLWFPTLARTDDGRLLATMNDYADAHAKVATCRTAWSDDGGLTWSAPQGARYGDICVNRPGGELLLLPYYLRPIDGGLGAPYQTVAAGKRELRLVDDGVRVTGWPRPLGSLAPDLGLGGFVFNGQSVRLRDGAYLATLYGRFEGDKFFSLVGAESRDGVGWSVRSIIADQSCGFRGSGPSESAVCRLRDGRLMCIFRTDGGLPYGLTFSTDDGKTWDKPTQLEFGSVEPSLVVLDDGAVVLTGGRPGLFAWFNADGAGTSWQPIDLALNHNATCPDDPITDAKPGGNTSSYTEVVSLGDGNLLVIYDRLARGWKAIPPDSPETNSVWVVRLAIERGR